MSKDEVLPYTSIEADKNSCKIEQSCPVGHDVSQTGIWVPKFSNYLVTCVYGLRKKVSGWHLLRYERFLFATRLFYNNISSN